MADGFSFEAPEDFVLSSSTLSDAFAIDPSVFMDKENKTWLVYGSMLRAFTLSSWMLKQVC